MEGNNVMVWVLGLRYSRNNDRQYRASSGTTRQYLIEPEVHTMSYPPKELVLIDLNSERNALWQSANEAVARRAGSTIYRGDGIRQTMVVLLHGAHMAEHSSPQEGFIHVIEGAGHYAFAEKPSEYHDLVRGFLEHISN